MASRKPGRHSQACDNPLEAQKRLLEEKAARIKADLEQNKRLIERAPKLKERAEKIRQEEFVKRRSATDVRFGRPGSLEDPRHGFRVDVGVAAVKERQLRRDQNRGMLTFFMLCAVLCGVVYWVYAVVIRGLAP
jgi:hypothetical protein